MNVSLDLTSLILPLIRTIQHAVKRMKKNKQLNVRLPHDLREELESACKIVGLDAATVTRACLQAFVDQVVQTGEIRLPLAIVPKASAAPHAAPAKAAGIVRPRSDSTAALRLEGDPNAVTFNAPQPPPVRYPKKRKPLES